MLVLLHAPELDRGLPAGPYRVLVLHSLKRRQRARVVASDPAAVRMYELQTAMAEAVAAARPPLKAIAMRQKKQQQLQLQ